MIYIKGMVCIRCIMAVETVLREAGICYRCVQLGKAELASEITAAQKKAIHVGLRHFHLELIEDKTAILVERIKTEITTILNSGEILQHKLSAHLGNVLGYNYTYLANTFSEKEQITLEHYFIAQRIEKAKELLVYEKMTSAQIADELQYSSVSHFSVQFKKITGITPAEFRKRCQSENYKWRILK